MMDNDLKNIIESLVFVSDSPVDIKIIKKVIPTAETRDIRQAVIELIEIHEARQGGFVLREVAGGWQFRTRSAYKEYVKRLVQPSPSRLSKAALETLAIIAYHQPIIRSDIEHIRGVDSGAILRSLLERKLIRILGKKELPGRPLIYGTTKRFLEVFNLRSLNDMPSLKEIESFGSAVTGEDAADDDAAAEIASEAGPAADQEGGSEIESAAEPAPEAPEAESAPEAGIEQASVAEETSAPDTAESINGADVPDTNVLSPVMDEAGSDKPATDDGSNDPQADGA
jgi:segregation and condensation protein B